MRMSYIMYTVEIFKLLNKIFLNKGIAGLIIVLFLQSFFKNNLSFLKEKVLLNKINLKYF